jgi:hypothetical protein
MEGCIKKYAVILIYKEEYGRGLVKLDNNEIIPVYQRHFSKNDRKTLTKGTKVCVLFKKFVSKIVKIIIIDEEIS